MTQQTANVNVPMNQIIDQLHQKYARIITNLMQENAEWNAGMDVIMAENAELKGQLAALRGQGASGGPRFGSLDLAGQGNPAT